MKDIFEETSKIFNENDVSDYQNGEGRYNLKDQFEQLTGTINTNRLEEVNLIIGIIISVILLAYFIS